MGIENKKELADADLEKIVGGAVTEEAGQWYLKHLDVVTDRINAKYGTWTGLGIFCEFGGMVNDNNTVYTLDELKGYLRGKNIYIDDLN